MQRQHHHTSINVIYLYISFAACLISPNSARVILQDESAATNTTTTTVASAGSSAPICPPQLLSSPLTPQQQYLGIFGFTTATSSNGEVLAIGAPGELPSPGKRFAIPYYFDSQGNIYTAARASRRASPPTTSSRRRGAGAPTTCSYSGLSPLAKPRLSTPFAQAFGVGLAMSPDGSYLLAGVGGCYVPAGGLPPPCPAFPAPPVSGLATDDLLGGPELKEPSLCDRMRLDPWTPWVFMSNCTDKPGALSAFTTEQDTETEMDVLWLYKRSKLRGPGYNLDAAASRPLTLTAPLVGNQTIYPELFFYTTPTAMSLSVSNDALVIAASALIAYVNNASTAVPLVTPSGFQVFRRRGVDDAFAKVMMAKALSVTGEPCSANNDRSCWASRAKWPTISSDGSLLVTAWGDAEPESGPPLTPVFLHTWNGSAYTARLSINYTIAQAPSSPIAISPDGAFIAIPSVRSDERAGGALQSYLELRGLRLPEQSRSGPALTVLECSFFVPGLVNPLSSANLATGVSIVMGPKPDSLRLIVSRAGNSTLVFDFPVGNSQGARIVLACPTPTKPTAEVQRPAVPGVEPGTPTGWGSRGTQSASRTSLVAGMPSVPVPDPGRPNVPAAGVVAVVAL